MAIINKPSDYFNTKLYTGDGNTTQSITGVGFQPDFSWVKNRDNSGWHRLTNSVVGATKHLFSNSANDEDNSTDNNGYFESFDSDGVTVNRGLVSGNGTNLSGNKYVLWNWKAGGTASSNTDGSITSSVSANTTSGFSIVSYTGNGSAGATIGHSLGTTPSTIIVKLRNANTYNWNVYHKSLGATKTLKLNLTNAEQVSSIRWNDTEPTSSVFSLGNAGEVNENGKTYIAYCFAEKQGFSKFSSYVGNGSSDGSYIHLGFKPAFVLLKHSSGGTDNWNLYDNKRLGYNANYSFLIPNEANAENTGTTTAPLDLLSNGFKIRASTGHSNSSGETYIYMAFAENPFVSSTGVPATAR